VIVLRLRNMTAIDATGLQALENLAQALHASGRTLVLCGAREQPAMVMQAAEFHEHVGPQNICPNIKAALQRAADIHRASAA
jgi:SulP family sulfate permease